MKENINSFKITETKTFVENKTVISNFEIRYFNKAVMNEILNYLLNKNVKK